MFKPQLTSVVLATLLATTHMTSHAQTTNPGASAATNAAIGGVSQGVVVAAVVGVAMVAALNSGSSGAVFKAAPAEFGQYVELAAVVNTRVAEANKAVSDALAELETLTGSSPSAGVTTALDAAKVALVKSQASQVAANQALQDLQRGQSAGVAAVMSGTRRICAAELTCTLAELQTLTERHAGAVRTADADAKDAHNKSIDLQLVLRQNNVQIPQNVVTLLNNSATAVTALATEAARAVTKSNENATALGTGTTLPTAPSGTVATPGTTGPTGSI